MTDGPYCPFSAYSIIELAQLKQGIVAWRTISHYFSIMQVSVGNDRYLSELWFGSYCWVLANRVLIYYSDHDATELVLQINREYE
jgi:hypothetical protein